MPAVTVQNNFLSILQERLEMKVSVRLRSFTNPVKRLFQVKIKKKKKKKKTKKPRSKEEKLVKCL